MKKILLLQIVFIFLFCSVTSTPTFGQRKTKPQRPKKSKPSVSQYNDISAEAKKLTENEKQFCLKILKILDSADAIFTTSGDPKKFKETVAQVIPLIDELQNKFPNGTIKNMLSALMVTYLDFGILFELGATRETQKGALELTNEDAEKLAEIKRRCSDTLKISFMSDILDPDNMRKIYLHGQLIKELLYGAFK